MPAGQYTFGPARARDLELLSDAIRLRDMARARQIMQKARLELANELEGNRSFQRS